MTIQEIAKYSGASYATVRRTKLKLGRMPTIEEMISRKGKVGRPSDESNNMIAANLQDNRILRMYVNTLIDMFGEETKLKDIIQKEN